ncbi:13171_t:CDS:2 [Gigaspora rosea]|nr:13171_t:CDS:2 [Gigaspora rosea]
MSSTEGVIDKQDRGILDAPDTINDLTQSTITIVSDIATSFESTVALLFSKFLPLIGDVASVFNGYLPNC